MRSTGGWIATCRPYRSNGTLTISSAIVAHSATQLRCSTSSRRASLNVGWNCTSRRRRSSIARTRTGPVPIRVKTFDFLGYTFRPRLAKWPNGKFGVSFLPAASKAALKSIRRDIRLWGLKRRSDKNLDDLARIYGPYIRGWINYYSHFYKAELYPTLQRIDAHLVRWIQRKFKRFRQRPKQARLWLVSVINRTPGLFPHWRLLYANGRMLGAV